MTETVLVLAPFVQVPLPLKVVVVTPPIVVIEPVEDITPEVVFK
jgi:hypothetical protein